MKAVYTVEKHNGGNGYRHLRIEVHFPCWDGSFSTYDYGERVAITWQSDNGRDSREWCAWYGFNVETRIENPEAVKRLTQVTKALTVTTEYSTHFAETPAEVMAALEAAGCQWAERQGQCAKYLPAGEYYIADVRDWGHIVTSNGRTENKARGDIVAQLGASQAATWAGDGFPMARVCVERPSLDKLMDPANL